MEFSKDAKAVMSAFTKLSIEEKDGLIDYMIKMVEDESLDEETFEPKMDFSVLKNDTFPDFPDDIYTKALTLAGFISEERLQNDNSIYEKVERVLRELIDYIDSL